MSKRTILALFLGLLMAAAASPTASADEPPKGFKKLFNGKDLSGWRGRQNRPQLSPYKVEKWSKEKKAKKQAEWNKNMRKHWRVEDGQIVNDGHGVYLTTEKDYRDFELMLEYKTVAKADSGIYLRANPQVQIWDTTKEGGKWKNGADKGSGALWNNKKHANRPLVHADKPFGEWNSLHITMIGERVTVVFNGELVVDNVVMENFFDRSKPVFVDGPIQLQTHGGEIRFRDVFIKEISPAEANRRIRERHAGKGGFEKIFNGKDFTGWADTGNSTIQGESFVPQKGTPHTEKTYEDFEVMFAFKLPKGGNNGLAIRYPGKGNASQVGMCELQVIDNTADKYKDLDPRQYHGSAYGMVAAHRGYLRETGEWNIQHVRVKGHKIQVELNGTQILDADLSKVDETMKDRPHPGRDRLSGHFGFAGHRDPVQYRDIELKELK